MLLMAMDGHDDSVDDDMVDVLAVVVALLLMLLLSTVAVSAGPLHPKPQNCKSQSGKPA